MAALGRHIMRRLHITRSRHQCTVSEVNKNLSGDELLLKYTKPGVAVIGINRPKAKNSLSFGFIKVLEEIIDVLNKDQSLLVAILKSEVPGVFCAGADLKERAKMTEADVPKFVAIARNLFNEFSKVSIPTIAAIDGAALGGGLELALACDLRVASDNAKIGLPETKLAIIPGAGGTQRLPRLVGLSKAKELIFTGKALKGADAVKYGVVDYSVPPNEAGDAAYQRALLLANEILPQGPVALRAAKRAINEGIQVDIDSGLLIEESCYAQIVPTEDRTEGLRAFAEKRKPNYKGR
ncbi:methylglutaconyl-CoA hydratase, mitochondrial-like [Rhopilema esculentum]|uniref:methylglutaconyl-CoA hydratase, mitochondrial-like n=1 Tax=Rhopilema esculentum TaxID=499914 RepID=UPI0031CE5FB0